MSTLLTALLVGLAVLAGFIVLGVLVLAAATILTDHEPR